LAGDGDWGAETNLPWGMAYPNAIVGWAYAPGVRVHPTPLYEFFVYTLIFFVLHSMQRRHHADGTVFWWYLVLAPAARFLIEFVRINPGVLLGLTEAQWISLALIATGGWKLLSAKGWAVESASALRSSKQ